MFMEQRAVDAAAADRLEQREQAAEDHRRIDARVDRGAGRGAQELRYECVETLSRPRRQLKVACALPHARERLDESDGSAVAGRGERCALRVFGNGIEPDRG